jgi:Zn-dependent metalloprotease
MESHVCSIVSPHLLDALAVSEDPKTRQLALDTLAHSHHVRARRKQYFDAKSGNYGHTKLQGIVPDQILEHIASSEHTDGSSRDLARRTLDIKQTLQDVLRTGTNATNVTSSPKLHRQIYDMQNIVQLDGRNDETFEWLPGKLVRSEGEAPITDEHPNQAYDNCATLIDFYQQVFDYTFSDDHAAPVISSIHFENGYQNAQWVGDPARQMIYGDGGHNMYNFTACLDVIGHEMTVGPCLQSRKRAELLCIFEADVSISMRLPRTYAA